MSEGGIYPWKRQTLNVAKAADYSNLQNPLPNPPPGKNRKASIFFGQDGYHLRVSLEIRALLESFVFAILPTLC